MNEDGKALFIAREGDAESNTWNVYREELKKNLERAERNEERYALILARREQWRRRASSW